MATLASSCIGLKSNRTAAHAAVRDLAESFGVDLLPLELNTDLTITPGRPQSGKTARRSCDISRTSSLQEDPPTPSSRNETPSLPRLSISSPKVAASAATSGGSTVVSPAKSSWSSPRFAVSHSSATVTSAAAESAPDAADASQPQDDIAAAAEDAAEDEWADNPAYLSEAEYIKYQIPLEQQLLSLEEERDILVDKLLSTTAALHASEARNRESQASASQVAALLNQLQELLRRAEVERDKAKMQLKRQRLSASQVPSSRESAAFVAQLAAAGPMSAPCPPQQQLTPATSTSTSALTGGNEAGSAGYTGGGSSNSSSSAAYTTGADMQQRLLKKHKNNIGQSSSSSLPALEPQDIYELPRVPDSGAAAPEAHSGRSSCASGDSSIERPLDTGAAVECMALMPSSNEARPPVKSVIHGFEALMKQRARKPNTDSAAGSRRLSAVARTPDPSNSEQHGAEAGGATVGSAVSQTPAAAEEPTVVPPPNLQPVLVVPSSAAAASSDVSMHAVHQQLDCSSVASTPTAAAIYNESPTTFAAEAAQAAAGVAHLEAAMAASYAEVTKRNSSERSASSSQNGSRSPPRRALRSPRIAAVTSVPAAGRDNSCSPKSNSTGVFHQAAPWDSSSSSNAMFAFGHTAAGSSKRSSSSSGSQSPRPRSPTRYIHRHGSSRLGPAAATGSTQCLNGSSVRQQQQWHEHSQPQQQHPRLYNPAAYASSPAEAPGPVPAAACSQHPQQQGPLIKLNHPSQEGQAQDQSSSVAGLGDAVRSSNGVDAAVQVLEPLGDCSAEVRAALHPAAPTAAARDLDSGGQTARSGCSSTKKKRSHGGQQRLKQAAGSGIKEVFPSDAPSPETCETTYAAGSKGVSAVSSTPDGEASSRSSGPWTVLKLVITAILLLITGGLVAAVLLQSMQPAQRCQSAETELQARLAAAQQEVVVLQRQLSEQTAACGATAAELQHSEL